MEYFVKKKSSFNEYQNLENKSNMKLSMLAMIKDLKKRLMSRNTKNQSLAICIIYKHLKSKNSKLPPDALLKTDIPGLLCDVLNNHNPALIKNVFYCLLELSRNELFYEQNHSEIVIDTTCRTLKILTKKATNMETIDLGIRLLSQTLTRYHSNLSVNSIQVFGLVKDVFFNLRLQPVHLNTMTLLRIILKDKEFHHKDLLPLVDQVLMLLSKLNRNNSKKFNKNITLAADIMLYSLRLCCEVREDSLSLKISNLILSLLQSSVVPFIQKLDMKRCHAGFVRRLLNCLVSLYLCMDGDILNPMSNNLAARGFLSSLPAISVHYQNQALHSCVTILLSHILVNLAVSNLGLSDQECHQMTAGLHALPPDLSQWLPLLRNPQNYKLYPAIIIYFYFFFLCTGSFQNSVSNKILLESSAYLSALCCFFKSHTSHPSVGIVKAVWILFAVLSLSQPSVQQDGRRHLQAASGVLISWLQTSTLSSVYTHHPALLLWSFSSLCTSKTLQMDVTIMWMRDTREPSLKQIEHLALSNREAMLCLLKVLNHCSQDIILQVFTILKKIVERDKLQSKTDMSISIWENLPRTLSMLLAPQPETKVHNVSCVVYLACKIVPAWTDTSVLFRVSLQLLSVIRMIITDPDLAQTLHSQLFKLAHVLVIKMNQCKDYRVLETFLKDRTFLQTLLSSLNCLNHLVTLPALKLLSFLQYQQGIHNIQVKMPLYVSGQTLLRLVASPGNETVFFTLGLFSQIVSTNRIQPVLALPNNFPEYFILSLYLEFQMLTFKTSDSWRCQALLLQFCKTHNSHMELHLLTQPWMYRSLKMTLSRNGLKNIVVLEFLQVWLEGLRRRRQLVTRSNYSRALCQDNLSQTLTLLATTLVHHEGSLDGCLGSIATKVCNLGANIPDNVIQCLRSKV